MSPTELLIHVAIDKHGQAHCTMRLDAAHYEKLRAEGCEVWAVRARIPGRAFGALTEGNVTPADFTPSFEGPWDTGSTP